MVSTPRLLRPLLIEVDMERDARFVELYEEGFAPV
jgi:hypothetical protein